MEIKKKKKKKKKTNLCREFGLVNSTIQNIWKKESQNY
jgi:hypothetical protein